MHHWQAAPPRGPPLCRSLTQKARRRVVPDRPTVTHVERTADERRVVAALSDHTVRVLDARAGGEVHRLKGHQHNVQVLQPHPSGACCPACASKGPLACVGNSALPSTGGAALCIRRRMRSRCALCCALCDGLQFFIPDAAPKTRLTRLQMSGSRSRPATMAS